MKQLTCDIQLGGSTGNYLTWSKSNLDREKFIESLELALKYRAKTKPTKIARRLACLIGLVHDQLDADPYLLDCIIKAFNNIEKELNNY